MQQDGGNVLIKNPNNQTEKGNRVIQLLLFACCFKSIKIMVTEPVLL